MSWCLFIYSSIIIEITTEHEFYSSAGYVDSMMNSTVNTSTANAPQASSSPSPSPLQTTDKEDTDFAFGHHLSLPVDSDGHDTEVVFPRHYSWTTDHGEVGGASGGGRSEIRLQLEQNGTTLQVSIDSGDLELGAGLNVSSEIDEEMREAEGRQ